MFRSTRRYVAFICLLLFVAGCGGTAVSTPRPTVMADYDPDADFTYIKTYDWMPESPHPTGDPQIDSNRLLHARIRNAVDKGMAAKGYVKYPAGTPDVLLGYHVTTEEKTSIQFLNSYYGYSEGWGWSHYARTGNSYQSEGPMETVEFAYQQGTLILDIAEAESRQLIWRGVATATIEPDSNSDEKQQRIDTAAQQILAQFPPINPSESSQ